MKQYAFAQPLLLSDALQYCGFIQPLLNVPVIQSVPIEQPISNVPEGLIPIEVLGALTVPNNSGARILMTPACDDENIYFGNLKGDFFSLNKQTGKPNWGKKLGSLFNTTPLITKNYIILPDQFEKVYFIDKNTGDIVKTYNFEGRLKLSPVIKNGNILFIGYDNGILEAYEIL